ncbi:hypothetical protein E2320_006154 [Naja naja]|nr:hypothetical protein E2320_006154 [Naja naja]
MVHSRIGDPPLGDYTSPPKKPQPMMSLGSQELKSFYLQQAYFGEGGQLTYLEAKVFRIEDGFPVHYGRGCFELAVTPSTSSLCLRPAMFADPHKFSYRSGNASDCVNGSEWILSVFHECAQDGWDIASVVLGLVSIACFAGASFP